MRPIPLKPDFFSLEGVGVHSSRSPISKLEVK